MIQAIDRQQAIIEKLPNLTTEQQQQVFSDLSMRKKDLKRRFNQK